MRVRSKVSELPRFVYTNTVLSIKPKVKAKVTKKNFSFLVNHLIKWF